MKNPVDNNVNLPRFFRIATVPYSNAFPLIQYLQDVLPHADITQLLPSEMKLQLAAKNIDLALMPIAEMNELPNAQIVSNCCIACNGEVQSVLIYSKVPLADIKSIALDSASKTSVKACEFLLRQFYNVRPKKKLFNTRKHLNEMSSDAFLIIGDPALMYNSQGKYPFRYDLGQLWQKHTGLPLVFAAWISCSSEWCQPAIIDALEHARNKGLTQLEHIVAMKHSRLPLPKEEMLKYYQDAIIYTIREEEQIALEYFRKHC